MSVQYGDFLSKDQLDLNELTCHGGEHTKAYAYNLCKCMDCPQPAIDPQTCTTTKACAADSKYDYRQHDIVNECITTVTTTPMTLPATNCETPSNAHTCHYYQDPHFSHFFYSNVRLDENHKSYWQYNRGNPVISFRPSGVFSIADTADGSFEMQSFFCPYWKYPSLGAGVAMRFGTDIIQVIKGASTEKSGTYNVYDASVRRRGWTRSGWHGGLKGPRVNYTDFYVNGKQVSWEELGDATGARGNQVSGNGGVTVGNAYLRQMKPSHSAYWNTLPVCAGNAAQDTIVEISMNTWSIYNQRVSIRTSQPGLPGRSVCSAPDVNKREWNWRNGGRDNSGLPLSEQEKYRVRGKDVLFTTKQLASLCSMCGLDTDENGSCEAPGYSVSPEALCKDAGADFEKAKEHCAEFKDELDWFNACVMEYCIADVTEGLTGAEAVSMSRTEHHIQEEFNAYEKKLAEHEAEGKKLVEQKWKGD